MDISKEEKLLITQLRDTLGLELTDHYNDDYNLLRWIRGWGHNLTEILPRLRKHLTYRRALNLDAITTDDAYLNDFLPVIRNFWPGGVAGCDKQGNVVVIDPVARADPHGLLPSGRCSEFIRSRLITCELYLNLIRESERKNNHKAGLFLILDLEEFSLDKIWMPTMNIYCTIISLMQENYPDMLTKLYVIKSPATMQVAYKIILPFLSKHTREKIHFLGNNWQEKLLRDIEPSNLPVFWGGENRGPHGDFGSIGMGGSVSPSFHYKPRDDDPKADELVTIAVPRGDRVQLAYDVSVLGCKLQWYFLMPAHDIEFGVFLTTDSSQSADSRKMVVPKFRINCELVPEYGTFDCLELGTYLFEFDNSYSWLRSKVIKYKIDVVRCTDASVT